MRNVFEYYNETDYLAHWGIRHDPQKAYSILIDENGQPYIAHSLWERVKSGAGKAASTVKVAGTKASSAAKSASSRAHKYIEKIGEGAKARYFYTQEELRAFYDRGKAAASSTADKAKSAAKSGRKALKIAKDRAEDLIGVTAKREVKSAEEKLSGAVSRSVKSSKDATSATERMTRVKEELDGLKAAQAEYIKWHPLMSTRKAQEMHKEIKELEAAYERASRDAGRAQLRAAMDENAAIDVHQEVTAAREEYLKTPLSALDSNYDGTFASNVERFLTDLKDKVSDAADQVKDLVEDKAYDVSDKARDIMNDAIKKGSKILDDVINKLSGNASRENKDSTNSDSENGDSFDASNENGDSSDASNENGDFSDASNENGIPSVREYINGSSAYRGLVNKAVLTGVLPKAVAKHNAPLSEDDIISRISGGDETVGSCSSLALTYIANKAGFDVLDFRGGSSCNLFANTDTIEKIVELAGDNGHVTRAVSARDSAKQNLLYVEEGKEYYFAAGAHAAMVKKDGDKLYYLELQSPNPEDNGWQVLNDEALTFRFACYYSNLYAGMPSYLIDSTSLASNKEFLSLLGYINTSEKEQRKGVSGSVK